MGYPLPACRWTWKLRFHGRRRRCSDAIHRGKTEPYFHGDAGRYRQKYRWFHAELWWDWERTDGSSGSFSQYSGKWRHRYRRWYGNEYSASQPAWGNCCRCQDHRQPGGGRPPDYHRRTDGDRKGTWFPDRSNHPWKSRHRRSVQNRTRQDSCTGCIQYRDHGKRQEPHHCDRASLCSK